AACLLIVGPAFVCFFFQAEDGIRDRNVTGVQTCALPISREEIHGVLTQVLTTATLETPPAFSDGAVSGRDGRHTDELASLLAEKIGRASCRERAEIEVRAVPRARTEKEKTVLAATERRSW